jgi:hypothetical protein
MYLKCSTVLYMQYKKYNFFLLPLNKHYLCKII